MRYKQLTEEQKLYHTENFRALLTDLTEAYNMVGDELVSILRREGHDNKYVLSLLIYQQYPRLYKDKTALDFFNMIDPKRRLDAIRMAIKQCNPTL